MFIFCFILFYFSSSCCWCFSGFYFLHIFFILMCAVWMMLKARVKLLFFFFKEINLCGAFFCYANSFIGSCEESEKIKKNEAVRKRTRRRKEERKMGRGTEERGMAVAVTERLLDFEEAVRKREGEKKKEERILDRDERISGKGGEEEERWSIFEGPSRRRERTLITSHFPMHIASIH